VKTDSDTAPTTLPGDPGFPTAGEWTLVTSDAFPDEASLKEKVFPVVTSRYVSLEAVMGLAIKVSGCRSRSSRCWGASREPSDVTV
jgi:hypothetical protein